jgi:glycosyltransferase involved in cell wall biosynthesis
MAYRLEPMNILFLATSLQDAQAGAAHHSVELINTLAARPDVRINVFATAATDRLHSAATITLYRWPANLRAVWRVQELWEVWRLSRELRRQPLPATDVCYTRNTALGLALRSVAPDLPIVSHIGSVIASRETVEETRKADADAWRTRFKARMSDRLEKQSYRAKRWLHLVSTPMVGSTRERAHQLPLGFFHVCPLGASVDRFNRRGRYADVRSILAIPDDAMVFLTVARLVRWKGVDVVIRALAKLSSNCYLIVVGSGPEFEDLQRLAGDCGVASRTRFVGQISEPASYYAASDVFVLPSRIESFGNVYAEAMLMGLPCIGMRYSPPQVLSSAEDVIPEGVAGFCVSDLGELTQRMKLFALDRDLRQRLGDNAYTHAIENYTIERYADTLLRLVRSEFGTH